MLIPLVFGVTCRAEDQPLVRNDGLAGKVICGYQGWFNAPDDGAGFQWRHQGPRPGQISIDLWPDVSELAPEEKFATEFKHADGSPAYLFSSYKRATVLRHFQWMQQYGLDGVFIQRFFSQIDTPQRLNHVDTVLTNCRDGAHQFGRLYGLMYDLSGMHDDQADVDRVLADYRSLVDRFDFKHDDRYIRNHGKPVIAIWGIGFDGRRSPLTTAGLKLIEYLKNDPKYGGNEVLVGVPTQWRAMPSDFTGSIDDLNKVLLAADIIQPWWVGRNSSPQSVDANADSWWKPDQAWCDAHGKEYMPVIYPGFTWYNLQKRTAPSNQVPRLGGQFMWSQFVAAKRVGAKMAYVAMFDEMDEGTAIFKVTNEVPDGGGLTQFVPLEGLSSDFYLKLTGQGTRLMRGEIGPGDDTLVKNARWTPFMPSLPTLPKPLPTTHGANPF